MSDPLRQIRSLERRLGRTEVIERPGGIGTWTPAFAGSGTAGTFTYTLQVGTWTRFGNRVFIDGHVGISAIGTPPTGVMRITGLPFAAVTLTNYVAGAAWSVITNFNYAAAAIELLGFVQSNSSILELFESFDNAAFVGAPAANFTNAACRLGFSLIYQIE